MIWNSKQIVQLRGLTPLEHLYTKSFVDEWRPNQKLQNLEDTSRPPANAEISFKYLDWW